MNNLGFDVLFKGKNFIRLLEGLIVTLKISLISIIISIILGIILGIIIKKNNLIIKIISRIYIDTIRILPQLVLLFIVYFGSTKTLKINLSGEMSAIIVFSIWGIAEMSEMVRGALNSINSHQYETGKALGFDNNQLFIYIIFPQALKRIIPLSINLITRMIKTTSLILMIGVVEIIKTAQQIIDANRMSSKNAAFGVYLVVLIIYFMVCFPISLISKNIEKNSG